MFTIDLLKGQGIPIKSRPGGAALLAVTIAVPVIAIIIMFGNYGRSRAVLSAQKWALSNTKSRIADLVSSVQLQEKRRREINGTKACFVEVADVIQQQMQWSPILEVIADNMPETLIMENIVISSDDIRVEVVDRNISGRFLDISVPRRTLQMTLYGKLTAETDNAVQNFLTALRNSSVLNEKTERIEPISQYNDDTKNVTYYSIECVFKIGRGR